MPYNTTGSNGLLQGVSEGLRLGLQGFLGERERRDKKALQEQEMEAKRGLLRQQEQRQVLEALAQGYQLSPSDGTESTAIGDTTLYYKPGEFLTPKQKEDLRFKHDLALANAKKKEALVNNPGQKALDEAFAKQYAEDQLGGGKEQANANLKKISDAASDVVSKKATGGLLQKIPGVGDYLTRVFEPEKAAVRQDVESVVMASMKQMLGSQFTENEGKKVLQTSFDPALPPEIIQARLNALRNTAAAVRASKEKAGEYFRTKGTLTGYKPDSVASADDVNNMLANAGAKKPGGLISEANAMGEEDARALQWAKEHPSDPRAVKILNMQGK